MYICGGTTEVRQFRSIKECKKYINNIIMSVIQKTRNEIVNESRDLFYTYFHNKAPKLKFTTKNDSYNFTAVAIKLKEVVAKIDFEIYNTQIDCHTPQTIREDFFLEVAQNLFEDGLISWGRIAIIFHFAHRIILKLSIDEPLSLVVIKVTEWIALVINKHCAQWIIEQGGWHTLIPSYRKYNIIVIGLILLTTAITIIMVKQVMK